MFRHVSSSLTRFLACTWRQRCFHIWVSAMLVFHRGWDLQVICLYAIAVQLLLKITMDSSEKERVPSIDELCSKIPILSEYCRKLDDHVKRRYLEKIAEVGVDPVEATDLLSYLVLETTFYTKQQFGGLQLHGLRIHYEYSRLHCLRKARCRRKSETFTANEWPSDLCLGDIREIWSSQISSLLRMQSRAFRILFTRSKRVILHWSVDKNSR